MNSEKYEERKRWFIDRIGKRVFRGPVSCNCETCVRVHNEGLIIADEFHAIYLLDCENELRLRYTDHKILA